MTRAPAIFFAGVGTVTLIGAYKLKVGSIFEPGPGFLPFLSSLVLIILSFFLMRAKEDVRFYWEKPLLAFALLLIYAAFLKFFGFFIMTVLLMTLLFLISGIGTARSLLYALAVSFCSYVLFKIFFKVPLPVGRMVGG